MNEYGQTNWHTKLRISAGFCIVFGVLRILACFVSWSFSVPPHVPVEVAGSVRVSQVLEPGQ